MREIEMSGNNFEKIYGKFIIQPVAVVRNNLEKAFLVAGKTGHTDAIDQQWV
jgi:hypothetical protein